MTSEHNLPYSLTRTIDQLKRDVADLKQNPIFGTGIQILGDGTPRFPKGFKIGSGNQFVSEPFVVPGVVNLGATAGATFDDIYASLTWEAPQGFGSENVTGYAVTVHKGSETLPTRSEVTKTTSIKIDRLEPNTAYRFDVMAETMAGRYSPPASITVTTGKDTTTPASPTGVTVASGVLSLFVSWTANNERDVANGAGMYRVRVSTSSNLSSPTLDALTSGTVLHVPDLSSTAGYYVGVSAIDSSGNESAPSTVGPYTPQPLVTPDLAIAIGGGNIVRNAGFWRDLDSWTNTGGVIDTANSHGVYDAKSLKLTGTASAYQTLTLDAGNWCLSWWVKTSGSLRVGATATSGSITNVESLSGGGTLSGTQITTSTATWRRIVLSFVVTTETATVRMQATNVSGTSYVDETQAEQASQPSSFAPRPGEIALAGVTRTEIADGEIITPKLAAGSVVADKIAARTIGADKIVTGAITANEMAANSITSTQISAGAITTDKLAANAITATQLAANSVTAAKIAANTITADRLAVTNSLAVGQVIQSSNYVAGSSGWRISGSGNAEFANVAIRGSSWVGGSIVVSNMLEVPHPSTPGAVRLAANVEFGANYSGTLFSGDMNHGLQVGTFNGEIWCHQQVALWRSDRYIGWYDSQRNRRVFYIDGNHDIYKKGPLGRTILQKMAQGGSWEQSGLIIENWGDWWGGDGANAALTFNTPDSGNAIIVKMHGPSGQILEVRNAADSAFAPIKASAFLVNSSLENKTYVKPLATSRTDKLMNLTPITFKRTKTPCSHCLGRKPSCEFCGGADTRSQAETSYEDSGFIGLSAENVAENYPELVSYHQNDDGTSTPDGIDYAGIVTLLLQEVQNLKKGTL